MTQAKALLTTSGLIKLLEDELNTYSSEYYPLHASRLKRIEKCSTLVDADAGEFPTNVPKRRAHSILRDLWTYAPQVFFLCASATTPTDLGTLKSTDYMSSVVRWWKDVEVPEGLTKTIDNHSDILPTDSRDKRQIRQTVSSAELLGFLLRSFEDKQVELTLPFSGQPLPFVRLDEHTKIELSWTLVKSFLNNRQTST
ncbi:hypothetical protein BR93DRAFT_274356 [Coniochaeta sp. PMI_546]|nr:hypothetical protein BR93DRAFT_274356 [Coniochaeta sp. PMI_546]